MNIKQIFLAAGWKPLYDDCFIKAPYSIGILPDSIRVMKGIDDVAEFKFAVSRLSLVNKTDRLMTELNKVMPKAFMDLVI